MKTSLIIVTLLLILSLVYNFVQTNTHEVSEQAERQSKEHHKKLADSLERRSKAQADSLEVAFATIRSLNAQTQEAREVTNVWKKKYLQEKSSRIGIKTESEYDSILNLLYARP